jgi:hypothetical protein
VFEVTVPQKGVPDFRLPWAAKVDYCTSDPVAPQTALEKAAYRATGDGDVGVLYAVCAAIDSGDPFASAGFTPSPGQVREINTALMLCPTHPYASKWRQAAQRGKAGQ